MRRSWQYKKKLSSHYKLYESRTWMARRSRMHRCLTSSNGHRLESMSKWARTSFRSLLEGLPKAGGEGVNDGMGPIASTFLMTSWQMFSMASDLELASLLPRPSHLPRDSWSWTSIFRRITDICSVLQQATQQMTHRWTSKHYSMCNKQNLNDILNRRAGWTYACYIKHTIPLNIGLKELQPDQQVRQEILSYDRLRYIVYLPGSGNKYIFHRYWSKLIKYILFYPILP